MVFFIQSMNVTGISLCNGVKCICTERYENYYSDNVDFWSGDIKNITGLEFSYISNDQNYWGLWEFIEKNSEWLSCLQHITFSQPLGESQIIDDFHDVITSKFDVYIDLFDNKIIYSFTTTSKRSNTDKSNIDKPFLGNHLVMKTITSIY